MKFWQEFPGPNSAYVLELYERYRENPEAVDEATRAFFEKWKPPETIEEPILEAAAASIEKAVAVANLAQATRIYGHLNARLNPLGDPPPGDPALDPEFHGLGRADLEQLPAALVGGPPAENVANAWEAFQALRRIYCSTRGYDYGHIRLHEERAWLQDAAESRRFHPIYGKEDACRLLDRLTQVEVFELFLHRTFPGKTRFSIEGLDMMVPMLDEIIGAAAEKNICMVFLGMAHRGRLNVLAHVHQKPLTQILAEFKDPQANFTTRVELGYTGDVKYHKGASHALDGDESVDLVVCMPPNPSHLEHINPVVEGMARAADSAVDQAGAPRFFPNASIPILIHGDASFTGQGVVAETLNLAHIPGYFTAGAIHIIANNQLGYTAGNSETRSTFFASDLAKGFKIPIMSVNADDPEACVEAARTAFAYRERFRKPFVIDLVGYRRYGHNEGDEPSFTQPVMYDVIRDHPSVRKQWAEVLQQRGWSDEQYAAGLVDRRLQVMQEALDQLEPEDDLAEDLPEPSPPGAAGKVDTAVPAEQLKTLNEALLNFPENFNINRKLTRGIQRRKDTFNKPTEEILIDWATAEELAFATILADGIPIRFSGEDVERGTFSQRHAVFHDARDQGREHVPLQSIPQARASFEIHNSPVTENAVLGFEFGYNIQASDRLVLWEAQYGDFINVAQVMVDEFIVSARAKWGQTPSLVLLLPHGNEGQGPDHSSARLERFLGLAAETNMRIAYPTTAAQYFHLLRRQAALLKTDPLPLIVMTPKGLLRHPMTASPLLDFAQRGWQPVLRNGHAETRDASQIRRVVFCSGRVAVDLLSAKGFDATAELEVVRLEQLYPFPAGEVEQVLGEYQDLQQAIWLQEEPANMGAWDFVRPYLRHLIDGRWPLHYIGRPASSSPAEGSAAFYTANQEAIVEQVLQWGVKEIETGLMIERGMEYGAG